jgi:hypothetical protein
MNSMEYLAKKRVNVEALLYVNDKNILHIGIRLRPWKQESRNPEMILVQGLDMMDALNNAARALFQEDWRRLDFQARPWNAPTFDTETNSDAEGLEFLAITPLSVTPKGLRAPQSIHDPRRGPEKPAS